MSRALGLASTSEFAKPADWTVWTVSLLSAVIWMGAASAQGAATQQTCVAGQSSLQLTRFLDNGDGTVTDVDSKLMWMRCPSGQTWVDAQCTGQVTAFNWPDAVREANQMNRNGDAFFNDWRLPALRDLATITDRGCENPRTNLTLFPGTPSSVFWTATPRPGGKSEDLAFALSFGAEGVLAASKDERFFVRFVRNAM
jgi:hypothetical protein